MDETKVREIFKQREIEIGEDGYSFYPKRTDPNIWWDGQLLRIYGYEEINVELFEAIAWWIMHVKTPTEEIEREIEGGGKPDEPIKA